MPEPLDLSGLVQFSIPAAVQIVPGEWAQAMVGRIGTLGFIVTEDDKGDAMATLSVPPPLKPTDAQVRAFFRHLGREPQREVPGRNCRVFLIAGWHDA